VIFFFFLVDVVHYNAFDSFRLIFGNSLLSD